MSNQKLKKFLSLRIYLILFIGIFLFFFWISNFSNFADPDSFYHVKIAELLAGGQIFRTFSHLPLTTLSGAFADQHLLYHFSLLPFFAVFTNHLFAVKIAANFFAAIVFVLFYWLLGKLDVKGKIVYLLVLLSSSTFIFRMNSPKAGVLSIILMLLAFWFLVKRKYVSLFFCSYVWVLTHGSWPLEVVMAGCFVAALFFGSEFISRHPEQSEWSRGSPQGNPRDSWVADASTRFFPRLWRGQNDKPREGLKILFSVLAGTISGLVINPFFPKNILFNWVQVFKIGAINYGSQIGVGYEWYPPKFFEFVSGAGLLIPLFMVALSVFLLAVYAGKKESPLYKEILNIFFSGIFLIPLFILSLKSRRNIEYFIPTAIIFSALLFDVGLKSLGKEKIKSFFAGAWQKAFVAALAAIILFSAGFLTFKNIAAARGNFQNGFSWAKFKNASEFLKNKTSAGEIIFHSDWDDFPMLFYWNDKNYYISGLDPTFLYLQDKELYKKYAEIISGGQKENLAEIIQNDFKSKYVLIGKDHPKMKDNIARDSNFKLIYEDSDAWVYLVKYKN